MQKGDLVRFRAPHWLGGAGIPEDKRPWLVGLLVEYHSWEKIATVCYMGEILRRPAREVEKAGKRDLR